MQLVFVSCNVAALAQQRALQLNEQPSRARSEHGRIVVADFFGANSFASALGIRAGATPCGQSRPLAELQREAVLAVRLHRRSACDSGVDVS